MINNNFKMHRDLLKKLWSTNEVRVECGTFSVLSK